MRCPICSSARTYAEFDTASIGLNVLSVDMYCKDCDSSWNAIFLHQYNDDVYDAVNNIYSASEKNAKPAVAKKRTSR